MNTWDTHTHIALMPMGSGARGRLIHFCIPFTQPRSGAQGHPADAWSLSKKEEPGVWALGCWTMWQLELQGPGGWGAHRMEDVSPELGNRPAKGGEGVGRCSW